jgi:hypothetical protein
MVLDLKKNKRANSEVVRNDRIRNYGSFLDL